MVTVAIGLPQCCGVLTPHPSGGKNLLIYNPKSWWLLPSRSTHCTYLVSLIMGIKWCNRVATDSPHMQKTLLCSQLEHGNPGAFILLQRTSAIPSEKAKGYLIVFKKTMHCLFSQPVPVQQQSLKQSSLLLWDKANLYWKRTRKKGWVGFSCLLIDSAVLLLISQLHLLRTTPFCSEVFCL